MRILMLMLIVGVTLGQSDQEARKRREDIRRREEVAAEWRTHARNIIVDADGTRRMVRPIWQSEAPAAASAKYKLAWNYRGRKAKELHFACQNLIQRAQMIEQGDLSKPSMEELSRVIHKYRLAWNEFTEAQSDLDRTPFAEARDEPPARRSSRDPGQPRQRPQQGA